MLQGGDPTGTGRGGKSAFKGGKPFLDEFPPTGAKGYPSHSMRGVLAMANSGPDSNGSQFYITYAAATHLDGKHTVFGRVVGGLDVLEKAEKAPVDGKDRPVTPITITSVGVFVNPFDEEWLPPEQRKAAAALAAAEQAEKDAQMGAWFSNPRSATLTETGSGITKFMDATDGGVKASKKRKTAVAAAGSGGITNALGSGEVAESYVKKKQKVSATKFGDFSGW